VDRETELGEVGKSVRLNSGRYICREADRRVIGATLGRWLRSTSVASRSREKPEPW